MLQLLPFSYTRHSLSFHLCNTLSLLGTAAAPSKSALALHMYFNFLFLFHFAHCATQHSTAQHSTTQHNTAQLFSTLFPLQALCMCVCVCNTPCLCVCVPIFHYGYLALLYVIFFFLLPSLCTRIHTDTQTHTLGTRSRTHTR